MNAEINKAIETIRNGGVILYPTDTVWGLGCDPKNDIAVSRISQLKKRNSSQSMIVLVASITQLENYIPEVPEICYDLIDFATSSEKLPKSR